MPHSYYKRSVNLRPLIYPVGPSIAYVQLTRGLWSVIDLGDAPTVSRFNWFSFWSKTSKSFYAGTSLPRSGGKTVGCMTLHGFLMGCVQQGRAGSSADHKSSNETLDNRRANLRIATKRQQLQNQGKKASNTSGFKGVAKRNNCDLKKAWRVNAEEAQSIIRCRDTDKAWPCGEIDDKAQIHFDMQRLRDMKPLEKAKKNG